MVGGQDKFLRFFRIDGENNEMQLSKLMINGILSRFAITTGKCYLRLLLMELLGVKFKDMPISTAAFLGNREAVVSGRRPYFYSYDLESGLVSKAIGSFKCV